MKKKTSKGKPPAASLKVVSAASGGESGDHTDQGEGIDFESVRTLARIATEFDLSEIEVDREGHMRVRRGGVAVAETAAAAPPSAGAARPIALTPPAPVEASAEGAGTFISSPFVGTFYRAPSPEAPSFVDVGQTVRKGQVVCIVEAMKLMNEIEADCAGTIVEILAENGKPVEFGQKLFRIKKA